LQTLNLAPFLVERESRQVLGAVYLLGVFEVANWKYHGCWCTPKVDWLAWWYPSLLFW